MSTRTEDSENPLGTGSVMNTSETLLGSGNPLQTPLGMQTESDETPLNTGEDALPKVPPLSSENQVDYANIQNPVFFPDLAPDKTAMNNTPKGTKDISTTGQKGRKPRKRGKKDQAVGPPRKKKKTTIPVPNRSLHSKFPTRGPRKSKNSSKALCVLSLDDILGKK